MMFAHGQIPPQMATFIPVWRFRIEGNHRPKGGGASDFVVDRRYSINLREHDSWVWFDTNLNVMRKKISGFPHGFVNLPPRQILHLIGYGDKIGKPEANFYRLPTGSVAGDDLHIGDAVNHCFGKFYVAIRPDFDCHDSFPPHSDVPDDDRQSNGGDQTGRGQTGHVRTGHGS